MSVKTKCIFKKLGVKPYEVFSLVAAPEDKYRIDELLNVQRYSEVGKQWYISKITVRDLLFNRQHIYKLPECNFSTVNPSYIPPASKKACVEDSKAIDEAIDGAFIIYGWMINRLNLKGTELMVYAKIYDISKDGKTEFIGSLSYLCDCIGGVSKPTVIKALKELVDKKYIIKRELYIHNVKNCLYKANLSLVSDKKGRAF